MPESESLLGRNNKEKNLIKNTLLFTVGNVGAKLLMLIIVPLYTYYVSTEQMGQYDLVNTYVNLFFPVACLAIYESIYRWLLDSHSDRGCVLKTGLLVLLASMIVFDVLALVVTRMLSYEYWLEFIILVDSAAIYTFAQLMTRGLRNNHIYAIQGILYTVCLIGCNILFVICLHWQARGLLVSMAIAYLTTTAFLLLLQRKDLFLIKKSNSSWDMTSCLVRYSLPLVPNSIAWWLVSASNRVIINWRMGDAANGIYSISMKFPTLVNMLSTFFYQAWQEQSISEYESSERDAYYTKIFNIYAGLLLSGIMALLPVTKIAIQYFMDSSYVTASHYVSILYLSSAFNAFASFYGTGYLSAKKTAGSFYTTICGAALNVILTLVLVSKLGLFAAALGNMMGNLAIWMVRIVQTRRYFNIQIRAGKIAALLLVNVIFAILVENVDLPFLIVLEFVTIALFLLFNRHLFAALLQGIRRKRAE